MIGNGCFGVRAVNEYVLIAQSSASDGAFPLSNTHIDSNGYRASFLRRQSIDSADAVLVRVDYSRDNFTEYHRIDNESQGDGITRPSTFSADALFTAKPGVGLFLQLADCVGAVLYDTAQHVLGVSHLGRHNLEQNGGQMSVQYMIDSFGSKPENILVFLSAAAGRENYPLFSFDRRSLHEVATEQLIAAGIVPNAITRDGRDTTKDETLFSHSQFLAGNRKIDGRFAIVAMLKK